MLTTEFDITRVAITNPADADAVVVQPREATLTEAEIEALSAKVVAAAAKSGATLRS